MGVSNIVFLTLCIVLEPGFQINVQDVLNTSLVQACFTEAGTGTVLQDHDFLIAADGFAQAHSALLFRFPTSVVFARGTLANDMPAFESALRTDRPYITAVYGWYWNASYWSE